MERRKNQHVVPHYKMWAVKGDGNLKCTAVVKHKYEAVEIARKIARNQRSELIIHNLDGKIASRDSYGRDPSPPKG